MRIVFPAFFVLLCALGSPARAMDGVNTDTGDAVTTDDNTVFTVGSNIVLYDADGNEMDVVVQSVKETEAALEVEVQDQDSGDNATIEFTK